MVAYPHETQVERSISESIRLELTREQVERIIVEWAKTYGFSHRADIYGVNEDVVITEIIKRSS